jgi:mono/diheme cytochrome c family protein
LQVGAKVWVGGMFKIIVIAAVLIATSALSQDKSFTLQTPKFLVETGFVKYLLPRFSLKTGIRITPVETEGDAAFGDIGVRVFSQGDRIWRLDKTDGSLTDKFAAWLQSDVGKRTIEDFMFDGASLFSADFGTKSETQNIVFTGDARQGEAVSLKKCGRCHVINDSNRMKAIGSTPSFALMRSFADWQRRYETFFMLNPHPAFTQVIDVTEPFAAHLPSPIVPIVVTLEEIEAIMAYVAGIVPAFLGAPMQSQ